MLGLCINHLHSSPILDHPSQSGHTNANLPSEINACLTSGDQSTSANFVVFFKNIIECFPRDQLICHSQAPEKPLLIQTLFMLPRIVLTHFSGGFVLLLIWHRLSLLGPLHVRRVERILYIKRKLLNGDLWILGHVLPGKINK